MKNSRSENLSTKLTEEKNLEKIINKERKTVMLFLSYGETRMVQFYLLFLGRKNEEIRGYVQCDNKYLKNNNIDKYLDYVKLNFNLG